MKLINKRIIPIILILLMLFSNINVNATKDNQVDESVSTEQQAVVEKHSQREENRKKIFNKEKSQSKPFKGNFDDYDKAKKEKAKKSIEKPEAGSPFFGHSKPLSENSIKVSGTSEVGTQTTVDNVGQLSTTEQSSQMSLMSTNSTSSNDFLTLTRPSFVNNVNQPNLQGRNMTSYVSPYSGDVQLNFTDLSLPGKNGLDLNLSRFYQSNQSDVEQYNDGSNNLHVSPTTYLNERYALGLGWSFGYPSVEIRGEDTDQQLYYHDGKGGSYRSNAKDIVTSQTDANGNYINNGYILYGTMLDNYYTDNVKFNYRDTSYVRDGKCSQYSFKTEDNTMQYFGKSGELMAIKDRFNNEIKFDYDNLPGENLTPFGTHKYFSLGTYWTSTTGYFSWNNTNSTAKTSSIYTYDIDLDKRYNDYYFSLAYNAVDKSFNAFSGSFEVYGILYNENGTQLDRKLILTETPAVLNQNTNVAANFSYNPHDYSTDPTYAKIEIRVVNGKKQIDFDDVRFSPKTPLLSKITDTIDRTVEFTYNGDIYTRFDGNTDYDISVEVKNVDGTVYRDLTYYRNTYTFTTDNNDGLEIENIFNFFWGCYNGDISSWADYGYYSGWASSWYGNPSIYNAYEFYGRPLVTSVEHRNSSTYFSYSPVTKKIGSGFVDTFRVGTTYDINEGSGTVTNPPINTTSYNYNSGFYTDETAYNKRSSINNRLDPLYGTYKVVVTNPSGALTTYEYTTHTYDTRYRLKFPIKLDLPDKEVLVASALVTADTTTKLYEYNDMYALTQPTKITTTEKVNNIERKYINKVEYSDDSCLPIKTTLPLTEVEANSTTIPVNKSIVVSYENKGDRMFLPKSKTYYQSLTGPVITEANNYDTLGRLTSTINAKGDITGYDYDDATYIWMPTRIYISDPENVNNTERVAEVKNTYTGGYGFGPTSVKTKYGNDTYSEKTFVYETKYGNVTQSRDEMNTLTSYQYDYLGRLRYVFRPSYSGESGTYWLTESYSYSNYSVYNNTYVFALNKSVYKSTYANATWGTLVSSDKSYYDDYGNMVYKMTDIGQEEYLYDNANRVVGYRDPRDFGTTQNTLTYTYDGFNRINTAIDRAGNKYQATFKSLSNEYSFVPYGSSTAENHYTENYDMFGNLTSTKTYPNGYANTPITSSYAYDLAGNKLTFTDGNNKATQYQYDKLNNLTQTTKADLSVVKSDYTKWGTPTNIKQYEGNEEYTISKSYDDRGLEKTVEQKGLDIQTRPWYYDYRPDAKISKITEPNGNIKAFGYDAAGNTTSYCAGSELKTLYYNYFGQIDKVTRTYNGENSETLDYTYNDKELLTSKYVKGKTTSYAYNTIGSLTQVTSPFNHVSVIGRDTLDRAQTITSGSKTFTYEYYNDGMLKAIVYPTSSIRTDCTYDNANRLKTMVTKKGTTTLKTYTYGYDNVGNITSISGSDTISYTYDDLYRLKTYTQGGITTTYTYDNRNNIKSETRTGYSKIYEYSGDNKLAKVTENGVETTYGYDLNGNLVSDSTGNEYAYDENNKMVYSKVNGIETTYKIGIDGLRESKTTSGVTKGYAVDEAGKVITETDGTNATAEIVSGHQPLAKVINGVYYYYIYNGHGDVVAMLDANGNTANTYSYDPWGKITNQSETVQNDMKYAGEYYDNETGSIYLRARYYSPNVGRFTSEDSKRDGLNWYSYCNNNPIMFKDPSGQMAQAIVQQLANTPAGQQILSQLNTLASQAGVTVATYIANNLPQVQQMVDSAGNIIPAVWDWSTNTAAPWLAEKSQQAGEAAKKAGNWVKEKWNNATNGDPNKDPSKGMNNKRVLENVKIKGYNVSMDLEKGGSGFNNIHIKVNNTKYFYNESVQAFTDSVGNRLPSSLRGNQQIIDGFNKAKKLINQGW